MGRPRNREVQTDPMWIHDLTDEDGYPVAPSVKINYVERYQEETQTEIVETVNMWSQTKEDVLMDDVWCQTGEDDYGFLMMKLFGITIQKHGTKRIWRMNLYKLNH